MCRKEKSNQIFSFGACLIISLSLLLVYFTLNYESSAADEAAINQCTDPANSTDLIIQAGLFASNGNFQSDVKLRINDLEISNWSYTFINGNSVQDIKSLRFQPGNVDLGLLSNQESITQTLNLNHAGKYTVLAHGTGDNSGLQPVEFSSFRDDLSPISSNKAKIRVIHASGFGPNREKLTLNVYANDFTTPVLDDLAYADQGFFEIDPGLLKIKGVDQSGEYVIFDVNLFSANAGELITLILYGDDAESMDVYTLIDCLSSYRYNQLTTRPDIPPFSGKLNFVNLAPAAAQLDATKLNLLVNGALEFEDQVYGSSSGYKQLESMLYEAQIKNPTSNEVLATTTFELEADRAYTLVAAGGGSAPYNLTVLKDNLNSPGSQISAFRFGNFLTGSAPIQVDVVEENGRAESINSLGLGDVGSPSYQPVPAAEYDFDVLMGLDSIVDPAPVALPAGKRVTLLAAGDGERQPYGVYKFIDDAAGEFLPIEPSRLYVAHLAPFAPTPDQANVSLFVDGERVSGFERYGDSTGYLDLTSGIHQIEVRKDGVLLTSTDVDLKGNLDYQLILRESRSGVVFSSPIEQNRDLSTQGWFGHFDPDQGRVDIVGLGGPLALGIAFGELGSEPIGVNSGQLNAVVRASSGGNQLINPQSINLQDGDKVTLLLAKDAEFGNAAIYAIVNGQPGVFLEEEGESAFLLIANLLSANLQEGPESILVKLDGETLVSNLEMGHSTAELLQVPIGFSILEVVPSNQTEPIVIEEITTEANFAYQFIVHGDSRAPQASILRQNISEPFAGVSVQMGNMSPSDSGFFSSIDIYVNDTLIANDLSRSDSILEPVLISSSSLSFKVTTNGGEIVLLETPALNFVENTNISLFAAGDGGIHQPFNLHAIVDNQEMVVLPTRESGRDNPPKLTLAQLSPIGSEGVAIKVNGRFVAENFRFEDLKTDITLPIGVSEIQLFSADGLQLINHFETPFLGVEEHYFAFVVGGNGENKKRILGYRFPENLGDDQAYSAFLNLLPAKSDEVSRVDLILEGDSTIKYDSIGYLSIYNRPIEPGTYDPLLLTDDGKHMLANPSNITISQSDRVLLMAIGNDETIPISLYQFQLVDGRLNGFKIPNQPGNPSLLPSTQLFLPLVFR